MYRIFGYEPEEIEVDFDTYLDHIHPDDRDKARKTIETTQHKKEAFEDEYSIVTKDGTERILQSRGRVIVEVDKVVKMMGTCQDITRLKQAQFELQKNERKYRKLFEESRDAIFLSTKRGKFIDFNQAMLDMFGYSREELLNINIEKLYVDPRDRQTFIKKIAREEAVKDYEFELKRKDGSTIHCIATITLRKDFEKYTVYQGIMRDITKQKKAEQALLKTKERYQKMIEEIRDYAIFMLDKRGYIKTWNKGAAAIKGYKAKEVVGKHFSVFYTGAAKRQNLPEKTLEKARQSGRAEYTGWRVRKDGSKFWGHIVITAIRENNKIIGFVKVTRDLTEKRKAEKLKRKKELAERSAKMKSEFLANMSHEIRTPINVIMGMLQLLYNTDLNERQEELVNNINLSSDNLLVIINDILDISKIEAGKLELDKRPFELEKLLKKIIRKTPEEVEKACHQALQELEKEVQHS